jgi:hypothetical protein
MQRGVRLAVMISLVLVSAGAAEAKERHSMTARVCGASGCVLIRDDRLISSVFQFSEAFNVARAPRPAPFWMIEFRWKENLFPPSRYLYVPSRRRIRILSPDASYWRRLAEGLRAPLKRMTRNIKPYPVPRRWPRTQSP